MSDNIALLQQALTFYKARNIPEAENILRVILQGNPRDAQALHMMAVIGRDVKRYDFAEQLVLMALAEEPLEADFYVTLASIKRDQGKVDEALVYFQKSIDINPKHLHALLELANLTREVAFRIRRRDMLEGALSYFTRALAIRADEETYLSIAYIQHLQNRFEEAIETGKACLKRHPKSYRAFMGVAGALDTIQEYEQAIEYCKMALEIAPERTESHAVLANTLKNLGRTDESIAEIRKAIELTPEKAWIYSNMLLTMVYASSITPEELAKESKIYGDKIAAPLLRKRPFKNNKGAERKLRIGYVSPDFRGHAVSYFLAPLQYRNKENFEIFAYSKTEKEDNVTAQIKEYFDHWRDIKFMSDDAAADLIEKDRIDILVDLAGHTAGNGLLIFARKPAPIQVSWLGYPATTGLNAMDYRITDNISEPPGMTEHLNVEALWRLPEIFCVYKANEKSPEVINHPPFEDNGHITFGCFNNFTKVTDTVLSSWARIMDQVPNSKLLLEIAGIENEKIYQKTKDRLEKSGLPLDRVVMDSRKKSNQFVLYNKIDIALDPFPCNGGTTSMDALWMGVPFVTLAGDHFVSRMGVTILTNAGLPELIAKNVEEYVSLAVGLAKDQLRLRNIREGLREKFSNSPAMDQEKFMVNMESAYREMWKKWVTA